MVCGSGQRGKRRRVLGIGMVLVLTSGVYEMHFHRDRWSLPQFFTGDSLGRLDLATDTDAMNHPSSLRGLREHCAHLPTWRWGCALPAVANHELLAGPCHCSVSHGGHVLLHKTSLLWRCEALPFSCGNEEGVNFTHFLGHAPDREVYDAWDQAVAERVRLSPFLDLERCLYGSTGTHRPDEFSRSNVAFSDRDARTRLIERVEWRKCHAIDNTNCTTDDVAKAAAVGAPLVLKAAGASIGMQPTGDNWASVLRKLQPHWNALSFERKQGDHKGQHPLRPYVEQMLQQFRTRGATQRFDIRPWEMRGNDIFLSALGYKHPQFLGPQEESTPPHVRAPLEPFVASHATKM